MRDPDHNYCLHLEGLKDKKIKELEQQLSAMEAENTRLERAWLALQKRANANNFVEMEQQLAELELKVKLGDDFKERARYVAKATEEAWRETVAELEQQLSEMKNAFHEADMLRSKHLCELAELREALETISRLEPYDGNRHAYHIAGKVARKALLKQGGEG